MKILKAFVIYLLVGFGGFRLYEAAEHSFGKILIPTGKGIVLVGFQVLGLVAAGIVASARPARQRKRPAQNERDGIVTEAKELDWWSRRDSMPLANGWISTMAEPARKGYIPIQGGRDQAFRSAATAIAEFEQAVMAIGDERLNLMNVTFRERPVFGSAVVPLCPALSMSGQAPGTFRSLGIRVQPDSVCEIWLVVRMSISNAGFSWRLDSIVRHSRKGTILNIIDMTPAITSELTDGRATVDPLGNARHAATNRAAEFLPMVQQLWYDALDRAAPMAHSSSSATGDSVRVDQPSRRD